MAKPSIVLASGGTGGHIFPAFALAEAMLVHSIQPILVTDARSRAMGNPPPYITTHVIEAGRVSGGIMQKILGVGKIILGTIEAVKILLKEEPFAVVGFGGYPSVPTLLAAILLRKPIILHEQNAVIGRANRLFSHFACAIATSFKDVEKLSPSLTKKITHVGNPVRAEILALHTESYPATTPDIYNILVTGGSQGAKIFSQLIPAAVTLLPEKLRARIHITQQVREEDIGRVHGTYGQLGVHSEIKAFFTDMAARLQTAHLVIGRAGASTIAEIAVAGRPSILIPFAGAKDDHQTVNAKSLVDAGAAIAIRENEATPEKLAKAISGALAVHENLVGMSAAARNAASPHAPEYLAELVLRARAS